MNATEQVLDASNHMVAKLQAELDSANQAAEEAPDTNALTERIRELQVEVDFANESADRRGKERDKLEADLAASQKAQHELQVALELRTYERDACCKESQRTSQKWMDGLREIFGRDIDFDDPCSGKTLQDWVKKKETELAASQKRECALREALTELLFDFETWLIDHDVDLKTQSRLKSAHEALSTPSPTGWVKLRWRNFADELPQGGRALLTHDGIHIEGCISQHGCKWEASAQLGHRWLYASELKEGQ